VSAVHDLTQGSIAKHVARYASFIFVTMLFQTLYFLVDLYFVGRQGTAAVAAVSIAGNLTFVVMAMTQSLGVGTTTLVSQAMGARDAGAAGKAMSQSLGLGLIVGLGFGVVAFATRRQVASAFAADPATAELAVAYLNWFIPAMVLQFPFMAMAATLRGAGDVRRPSFVQMVTIAVNVILAPVLIAGWGTHRPLGVAGAGLATFLAVLLGLVLLSRLFRNAGGPLGARLHLERPEPALWRRLVGIGAPAGGEFLTMAVLLAAIQAILAHQGASAQAGFGVGGRVMQAIFLPGMAVSFALAPIAGQNVGARRVDRIRETFRVGVIGACAIMIVATAVVQAGAGRMVGAFTSDPAAVRVGSDYLLVISWNFVANGVIFACAGMFQAFGNTLPSLFASSLRVALYVAASLVISRRTGFELRQLWYLSVASVGLQTVVVLTLLRREATRRFAELTGAPAPVVAAAEAV
jgi:putative MATE family efflux protein